MGIRIASVSETRNKDVFTDKGLYCGKVEDLECDLKRFKIRSLVIRAQKGSYISMMLGNRRGLIIPFPMVQAIGDIIIIRHISAPAIEDNLNQEDESKPKEA